MGFCVRHVLGFSSETATMLTSHAGVLACHTPRITRTHRRFTRHMRARAGSWRSLFSLLTHQPPRYRCALRLDICRILYRDSGQLHSQEPRMYGCTRCSPGELEALTCCTFRRECRALHRWRHSPRVRSGTSVREQDSQSDLVWPRGNVWKQCDPDSCSSRCMADAAAP